MPEEAQGIPRVGLEEQVELPAPKGESEMEVSQAAAMAAPILTGLLTPPPLISETISRYKEKFKDAFYTEKSKKRAWPVKKK